MGSTPAIDPHGLNGLERPQVLFMRHPQTEANHSRTYLGRRNSPLTALGEEQAARAARALVAWKPTRIVCSPLERCRAVALPAARELGIEVEVDDRAVEICFGDLEGKTVDQARELGIPLPWDDPAAWPCTGAEPLEQVIERVSSLCRDLACTDGNVAVVTHGGIVRAVFAAAFDLPVARMWQLNVANVSSVLAKAHAGGLYLDAFGLTPEELAARRG